MFNDIDLDKNVTEFTTAEITEMVEILKRLSGNYDEYYSYENILARMIAKVPSDMDTREGSIIYDALAPTAAELANEYIEIQIFKDQMFVLTAIGQNLDKIGDNYGIPRNTATYAERIAQFTDTNNNLMSLPIGSRFAVPDSDDNVIYAITKILEVGKAVVTCEQKGTVGNEYSGAILPLFSISNLKEAKIISTQTPAQDKEDDDVYRARIVAKLNSKGFAGNIRAYKDLFTDGKEFTGTSEPKVFPVWNGGGTVKISALDTEYNALSNEFLAQLKDLIDPETDTGNGIGLAPIGHKVTIVTPTQYTVNISVTLDLDSVTLDNVRSEINTNLEAYLLSIRKNWVNNDKTSVYTAQVISACVSVSGVKNVTNVKLNDVAADINLTNDATNQYIPVLGTVTLLENEVVEG